MKLRNVIGVLTGSDPELSKTFVMVTGHYDHVGTQDDRAEGEDAGGAGQDRFPEGGRGDRLERHGVDLVALGVLAVGCQAAAGQDGDDQTGNQSEQQITERRQR